ncbi:MAG: RDD family protein [Candidatus Pacebacteria bacterium]|nr:RDD family protein [Candidatus Paceibacterota bacterium]
MEWYYVREGERIGPVSEDDFQRLVSDGTITPDTLVWHENLDEWVPYRSVSGKSQLKLKRPSEGAARDAACVECGRLFPVSEMVEYEGQWVCGDCKTAFFQRLREGAVSPRYMVYGGFWIRAGAKIIDGLIKWVVSVVIQVLAAGVFAGFPAATGRSGQGTGAAEMAMVAVNIVAALLQFAMAMAYDTFFVGKFAATPGKMACGLKVVTADGGRVTYLRALGRHFAEYLSMLTCYIGYIIAAFDDEKRTLHDHVCSTRVIKK